MREIVTDIEIGAPASKVWNVLTDLDRFPQWNPFIREAEGEVKEGRPLKGPHCPARRKKHDV